MGEGVKNSIFDISFKFPTVREELLLCWLLRYLRSYCCAMKQLKQYMGIISTWKFLLGAIVELYQSNICICFRTKRS